MISNFVSNWFKNPFQLWTNLLITIGVGYLIYHVLIKKDISLANAAYGIPDIHSYMKTHGHHYGVGHHNNPVAGLPIPSDLEHFPHINDYTHPAHPYTTVNVPDQVLQYMPHNNPYVTFS